MTIADKSVKNGSQVIRRSQRSNIQVDEHLFGLAFFENSCREGPGPFRGFSRHEVPLSGLMKFDLPGTCHGKSFLCGTLGFKNSSCYHVARPFLEN